MPSASAELTAVVSLESPRPAPGKPRTIVFDAGIYWSSSPDAAPLIAALRFYNDINYTFDDEGGFNFSGYQVVKMRKGAEVPSDGLTETDYDMVGDIIQLIPILGGAKSVNPKQGFTRAMLRVAGTVDSVDVSNFSFCVPATQWTSADSTGVLPVKACIPSESKWPDRKKALPATNSVVSFTGYLSSVDRDGGDNGTVKHFEVEVARHLDFLARGSYSPASTPSPNGLRKLGNGRRKLRFNFDDNATDAPSTPSPKALGKRPMREDSEESLYGDSIDSPSNAKQRRLDLSIGGKENTALPDVA
ncbi:hypothetical protein FA95DRAFT_1497831 [Auriscalpium vulgare]|uniref:Uncharacterized protein n=1 Tax=Auriscalpium vulgare TaxID=40419 RepID=A0ACB8RIH8_9AGAM|nr:hypothetical protein FA95DRAFT_1497831 [Auriscalpium vulgare]